MPTSREQRVGATAQRELGSVGMAQQEELAPILIDYCRLKTRKCAKSVKYHISSDIVGRGFAVGRGTERRGKGAKEGVEREGRICTQRNK